jgi:hypothetical protein
MSVSCECCLLSGRDFFVGLITRPEEFDEFGVFESDCEAWEWGDPGPLGAVTPWKKNIKL